MNCPARPAEDGFGKKCRNPLRPKAVNTRPSNTRAMTKAYFIAFSPLLVQVESICERSGHSLSVMRFGRCPASVCVLLGRGFHAVRMLGTMRTAHSLFVEILVCPLSGGGLLGGQV